MREITPQALRAMLGDGDELALLDVRDEGIFAKSHLFHAVPAPYSRLELVIDRLVPRRSARIVLCDDGDRLAERAAERLRGFGYTDVAILAGGVASWRAAGGELFAGVNVPSKAFGEHVEHAEGTPSISPEELKAMIDAGTDMVILDSRPLNEFRRMSIPGAQDCPGAELVHRIFEVAPRPEQLVVVNCAGRTRSIIGAQSLINAGIPNKVVALRNGTMGWNLAGMVTDSGITREAPPPGSMALARARAAAASVERRFGVRSTDTATVKRWCAEASRTTYLLDVRSAEEFAAGHAAGARHAPGGQLVQATDNYVGTRNARLVLIDAEGVRAVMTASWLTQLGWSDVWVWRDALATAPVAKGADLDYVLGLDAAEPPRMSASVLQVLLKAKRASVLDLGTSLEFRRGHIPGAAFAVRSRLAESLKKWKATGHVVLTSRDGVIARLAAAEVGTRLGRAVMVLDGGTAAWKAAGLPIATGYERMLDEPTDVALLPYDNDKGVEQAMRDYLTWEVALVAQLEREGIRFPTYPR